MPSQEDCEPRATKKTRSVVNALGTTHDCILPKLLHFCEVIAMSNTLTEYFEYFLREFQLYGVTTCKVEAARPFETK